MKKKFLFGAALMASLFTVPISANEKPHDDPDVQLPNKVYTHSWRDNWYIQLGAGAQLPLFEKTSGESNFDKDKITAIYEISAGHWFSPYFGFRINAQGGALHYDDFGWNKFKYANLNMDLTWDMFNSLGGVNEKRVFSIIPYIGAGAGYGWDYDSDSQSYIMGNDGDVRSDQWSVSASAGLEFRFRVHKNLDLFVDARAKAMADNFNNVSWGSSIEPIFSVMGGLSINLGKDGRHNASIDTEDYTARVQSMNDKINDMRAALLETQLQLEECEMQEPETEIREIVRIVEPASIPAVIPAIRFSINSAKVSDMGKSTLYDVAQLAEANPDIHLVIKGYADKKTGTETYNQQLSEKRAEAVRQVLVDYGVDQSRMTVQGFGSKNQPYSSENNWNRVVQIEIE